VYQIPVKLISLENVWLRRGVSGYGTLARSDGGVIVQCRGGVIVPVGVLPSGYCCVAVCTRHIFSRMQFKFLL
jgi:hypothetical protein